jgi:hypothetical protein
MRGIFRRQLTRRQLTRRQLIRCDRGNIESALTLIPLLLLFLAVSQMGISVYSRNTNNQRTQGAVAYAAMGSTQTPLGLGGNESPWFTPPVALPLPGGGSVLVEVRRIQNPTLTPFLPGGESFLSTGVAVQE